MILGVSYSQWLFILTGAGWTLILSVLGFGAARWRACPSPSPAPRKAGFSGS